MTTSSNEYPMEQYKFDPSWNSTNSKMKGLWQMGILHEGNKRLELGTIICDSELKCTGGMNTYECKNEIFGERKPNKDGKMNGNLLKNATEPKEKSSEDEKLWDQLNPAVCEDSKEDYELKCPIIELEQINETLL